MKPRTRAALALALAGVALLAGCQQTRRGVIPPPETTTAETKRKAQETATRAQRAAKRGDTDKAIELYREAISYDRELPTAWNNLGVLYAERQEYPDAVSAYNVAASLWPADPLPVTNIGWVWLDLGYARDALRHFEEALQRDPEDLRALRGAVMSAALLDLANEETAERIKAAMMRERDPEWSQYLQEQRLRVEGRLEAERRRPR